VSRSVFAAALVALPLALYSQPSTAQTLEKIRVTIPVAAFVFYPLFHAQDKGFFAKEGLDVEITSTNGDGPDVDALIAGSVQFTVSTPNRLFMSYEQGKPLLTAMTLANRMNIDCAMNKAVAEQVGIKDDMPFIEKLKRLKGLTVAGTRPGAFTYLLLQEYVLRAGLVPQKDVKIIGIGGAQSMLPALENAQIAVGCTGSPMPEMAVARGKAILLTQNMFGKDPAYDDFLFEMVYVRPDYAKANPETVKKFTKGLLAAVNSLVDTPTKDSLPDLKKRFSGVSDELIVEIFDAVKASFKRDGITTPSSVDKAGKFLVDTGAVGKTATFDQVATNEYLPKP
jgi:NitT/TauT family transport system substrate-binding protein